ncbi:hypothetical protein BKA67DRAFT_647412 [Truncatella angustata]|uniref:Uncharacterized protein n=1 Tax=Truncatella angustata TaxID=152316 RepID=A0A9P8ZWE1_9PEZI|nr:uncharacterized protein BKA67DRAFT_647412 [Truncatella angustata]KAH6653595.1 hypothetical protein BKA67DRAFT_647412 [Truncatella angustata]
MHHGGSKFCTGRYACISLELMSLQLTHSFIISYRLICRCIRFGTTSSTRRISAPSARRVNLVPLRLNPTAACLLLFIRRNTTTPNVSHYYLWFSGGEASKVREQSCFTKLDAQQTRTGLGVLKCTLYNYGLCPQWEGVWKWFIKNVNGVPTAARRDKTIST